MHDHDDPIFNAIERQYRHEDALAALELERDAPMPAPEAQTSSMAKQWGLTCGPDEPEAKRASHSPPAPVEQDDEPEDTSYDDDVPLDEPEQDDAADGEDADTEDAEQPVADPLPPELQEQLAPHMQRAVEATRAALRERFGERLVPTMQAANRVLARFASPALKRVFKEHPVFSSPDVVDLLAAVDKALRQGGRR